MTSFYGLISTCIYPAATYLLGEHVCHFMFQKGFQLSPLGSQDFLLRSSRNTARQETLLAAATGWEGERSRAVFVPSHYSHRLRLVSRHDCIYQCHYR